MTLATPSPAPSMVRYSPEAQKEICTLLGIEGTATHIALLFKLAEHYQLDVLTKEISLIPKKGPFIGVWGRLHIAQRSGKLDGLEMDDEWETEKHYCVRVVVWRRDMSRPAAKVIGRVGKHEGHTDRQTGEFIPKEWPLEVARARALRAALGFAFSIHDSYDGSDDDYAMPPDERMTASPNIGEEDNTGNNNVVVTGEVTGAAGGEGGAGSTAAGEPRTVVVGGHSIAQRIAIAANEAGLTDNERHDVICAATGGAYKRGLEIPEDVEVAVVDRILDAMVGMRDGALDLRYDADGTPSLWKRPRRV